MKYEVVMETCLIEGKTCSKCKVVKPKTEYHKHKMGKDGLRAQCKECYNKHNVERANTTTGKEYNQKRGKEWRKTDEYREFQRKYSKTPRYKERKREYKKTPKGKEVHKNSALKRKYNITLKEYNNILDSQGGKCAICESDVPGSAFVSFLVDHCHKTGKIRGLLCHRCNTVLGLVGDSTSVLVKLMEYLNIWGNK